MTISWVTYLCILVHSAITASLRRDSHTKPRRKPSFRSLYRIDVQTFRRALSATGLNFALTHESLREMVYKLFFVHVCVQFPPFKLPISPPWPTCKTGTRNNRMRGPVWGSLYTTAPQMTTDMRFALYLCERLRVSSTSENETVYRGLLLFTVPVTQRYCGPVPSVPCNGGDAHGQTSCTTRVYHCTGNRQQDELT